jgi:predicted MFS family arabinose efflux permease
MSQTGQNIPRIGKPANVNTDTPREIVARPLILRTAPLEEGLHYGWWIALSAMFSVFVSLGVGRFALSMLLPAMAADLGLGFAQIGWISTANLVGYLLGALWVRRLQPRYGERRLIFWALMAVIATMVGVSVASGFIPLLILYAGTGVGGGMAFVCTIKLVPRWFISKWRRRASGFLFAGAGLAMMLAGWAVPLINGLMGPEGWRLGWAGLAAVCLPLAVFCRIVLRNRSSDLGLRPFGTNSQPTSRGPDSRATTPVASRASRASLRFLIMRLGAIYFLFGASYVAYATFVVTTLVREHGMTEAQAGYFWIWLGFFTLLCGPVLGTLSDRLGRRTGLSLALFLQGSAYALIAYGSGEAAVFLSIALFGLSLFGVPLIIAAATADYLTPNRALGVVVAIAVVLGLGQIAGAILAALLAEYTGSFTPAYLAATALVALAIAITLTLPDPTK